MDLRGCYASDREYRGMYLKKDFFPHLGKVAWGVFYAKECTHAIEVFDTLPEAKQFITIQHARLN